MRPRSSEMGEMVSETSISSPFFFRRTVSKCSTCSPRRICSRIFGFFVTPIVGEQESHRASDGIGRGISVHTLGAGIPGDE